MYWVAGIGLIILLFIGYILFALLIIEINSKENIYEVRLGFLSGLKIYGYENSIIAQLKIGWWTRKYDVIEEIFIRRAVVKSKEDVLTLDHHEKKKVNGKKLWKKIKAIVLSFSVKKCKIIFDTGNMPLNAILYPFVEYFSRRTGKLVMISFTGENEVNIRIENSLARIAWAFISS